MNHHAEHAPAGPPWPPSPTFLGPPPQVVLHQQILRTRTRNYLNLVLFFIMAYHQDGESYPLPESTIPANANTDGSPDGDQFNGMPPPAEGTFPSLQDLMNACQDHARAHGYACVTSSNNYKRGIAYVRCDRGGEYVNHWKLTPETRVRKNRTRRLVGCNWKARAKRTSTGEWNLTMMNPKHNGHDRSESATQHPSLRQLPPEALEEARDMFHMGNSPKEVLEFLQERWNPNITAQDVYNLKAKIARVTSRQLTEGQTAQTPQSAFIDQQLGPPTDPRLLEHDMAVRKNLEHQKPKCQCTCCDH